METAQTLTELIDAARRSRFSAVHILREPDEDLIYARFPMGLVLVRRTPTSFQWFEQARTLGSATTIADRVVIAIGDRAGMPALSALGMPGQMRRALGGVTQSPGGIVVVTSPDEAARHTTMLALARTGPDRYTPWIEPTSHKLDLAGQMDCDAILVDAILVDGLLDRTATATAFGIAHAGVRVIIGIDAKDSIGALAALRALRVEHHLLGSVLRAVVAVRPTRALCPSCRISNQTSVSEAALLGLDPGTVIYRAAGCGVCDGTGYGPPVFVFESIAVDDALRRLLGEGADVTVIARHAFLMTPGLAGGARLLVREGVITSEDAIRVARESGNFASPGVGHPHILSSAAQWVDDPASPPLSARLRGDRSSIG